MLSFKPKFVLPSNKTYNNKKFKKLITQKLLKNKFFFYKEKKS